VKCEVQQTFFLFRDLGVSFNQLLFVIRMPLAKWNTKYPWTMGYLFDYLCYARYPSTLHQRKYPISIFAAASIPIHSNLDHLSYKLLLRLMSGLEIDSGHANSQSIHLKLPIRLCSSRIMAC